MKLSGVKVLKARAYLLLDLGEVEKGSKSISTRSVEKIDRKVELFGYRKS